MKKINWLFISISILSSVVIGWIQVKYDTNSPSLMSNILSATAIPSIVISCIVLIDVREVREKIKRDLANQKYLLGRDEEEKIFFYKDYVDKYTPEVNSLINDLTIIIKRQNGDSKGFKNRVISSTVECSKSIKSYKYIESCIKILESDFENKDKNSYSPEIECQKEIYRFSTNNLNELKNDLSNFSKLNSFEIEFCEVLIQKLISFNKFCDYQSKEIFYQLRKFETNSEDGGPIDE